MKHRGGQKRFWKRPGRMTSSKCYQELVRQKLNAQMVNNGVGHWIPAGVGGTSSTESLRSRALFYHGWAS